MISRCLNWRRN